MRSLRVITDCVWWGVLIILAWSAVSHGGSAALLALFVGVAIGALLAGYAVDLALAELRKKGRIR